MQEELERGSVAPPDAAWRSAVAQRGGEDQANGPHSRPSGTSMRAKRTGMSRTDATAPTRFTVATFRRPAWARNVRAHGIDFDERCVFD